MDVDHGLASIELIHHRRKCRVAEPFVGITGNQADAVRAQHVEGEFDLAQAAFDIGEGQGGEHSEAAAIVRPQGGPNIHCSFAQVGVPPASSPNHTPG